MNRKFCYLIAFEVCTLLYSCNSKVIHVSKGAPLGAYPNEPAVAVNPQNVDEVMVAANIDNSFYSLDGGTTFEYIKIKSGAGVWGNHVLINNKEGDFLLFHLSNPNGYRKEKWLDRIVCQKFDKQKMEWVDLSYLNGLTYGKWQDKPVACVNPKTGRIAVAWTEFDSIPNSNNGGFTNILFACSDDHGEHWSQPKIMNEIPGNCLLMDSTATGAAVCFGRENKLYLTWARGDGIWIRESNDNGETWSEHEQKYASLNIGWRFQLPGYDWFNSWPTIVADNEGVVALCRSNFKKDHTDIEINFSENSGESVLMMAPLSKSIPNHHFTFPTMKLSEDSSLLGILYYEVITGKQSKVNVVFDLYDYKHNTEYVQTISDSPFQLDTSVYLGDYIALGVHGHTFYPCWTEIRKGKSEIMMKKIETGAK